MSPSLAPVHRELMRKVLLLLLLGCRAPSSTASYLDGPRFGVDGEAGLGGLDTKLAQAMLASYHRQVEHVAPPLSLSPTDGSELELRALSAEVTLEGPLAHTELHLTFHNPEPRPREGRFEITLPSDAAVARFAMKTDREWREARVVTREGGRRVYESYLHKRVDPALLEQDLGNAFSARVFPIAAKADKEIVIAYDHRVSGADPYTLALRGLPRIANLSVAISKDGARTSRASRDTVPEDVVVPITRGNDAVSSGQMFVARVELGDATATAAVERAMILVDTSASRATIMGRQAAVVQQILDGLPADADVIVATFDQGVTELYRGNAHEAGSSVAVKLQSHGALGASDLGGALAVAAASGMARVIVVGDGSATIGEHEPSKLAQLVHGSKIERIDAVQVGTSIDRTTLAPIVLAGRLPGAVLDARDLAAVSRGLATAVPSEQPIVVEGAVETWPATTRGLAPGEPAWVVGRRAPGHDTDELAIRIGTHTARLQPHAADADRVQRAVAIAEVADLTERAQRAPEAAREPLNRQLETIALANNLVSARTSLLVLETDADEQRMLGSTRTTAPATAPTIDPTSTTQGITIDKNYIKNIPVPGRTFESALGASAGSQSDGVGVSFSGASSLESGYFVDGVPTSGGKMIVVGGDGSSATMDVLAAGASPEMMVRQLQAEALAEHHERDPAAASEQERVYAQPFTGPMADIMTSLRRGQRAHAFDVAATWQLASPGEVAAIIALGESLEARGSNVLAARAYGSLIDLPAPALPLAAGRRNGSDRADQAGEQQWPIAASCCWS